MRVLLAALLMLMLSLAGCADGGDDGGDGTDDDVGGESADDAMDDETDDEDDTDDPAGPDDDAEPVIVQQTVAATGIYPVNPALEPARFEVPQGATLQVTYNNEDVNLLVTHDIYFGGVNQGSETIASGESTQFEFTVDLPPGEYPFWCAVGNHRESGMEGTLVVTA